MVEVEEFGLPIGKRIVPVSRTKGGDQMVKIKEPTSKVVCSEDTGLVDWERFKQDNEAKDHIDNEVIELAHYRHQEYLDKIREFPEYYEFCLIDEYEDKYDDFTAHGIPLESVNIQVFELKNRIILVSIEFSKKQFNLDQVYTWLDNRGVSLDEKGKEEYAIAECLNIIEGVRFKGNPLVVYEKGKLKISYNPEAFPEITDLYFVQPQKVDTTRSKKVTTGLSVFCNGNKLKEIPKINFEKEDLVLCNGQCLSVDYMDEYKGTIGFFKNNCPTPIAYIADKVTTINIELEEFEWSWRCIVEYQYLLDEANFIVLEDINRKEIETQKSIDGCDSVFREFLNNEGITFEESKSEGEFILHCKYQRFRRKEDVTVRLIINPDEQIVDVLLYDYMSMEYCTKKSLVMRTINYLNLNNQFGVFVVDEDFNVMIKEVVDISSSFDPKGIIIIVQKLIDAASEASGRFKRILYSFS